MLFYIQSDPNVMDLELYQFRSVLQPYVHEWAMISLEDVRTKEIQKNACPVGTIDFVTAYLNRTEGISSLSPIEVPKELRLEKFLHRTYEFVSYQDLPKKGTWFVKDISELKRFSGILREMDHLEFLDPSHLFLISSPMEILSEYRVIVLWDEIKGIQFYSGNVCVMPREEDIQLIQEMILRYMMDPNRPKAYALDVAMMIQNGKRECAILEICPFVSVGTYGFVDASLPNLYQFGIQWYRDYNKGMKEEFGWKN